MGIMHKTLLRLVVAALPLTTILAPATAGATVANEAFSSTSYWNTPMPAGAPIDPNSGTWISDSQLSTHTQNFLSLPALRYGCTSTTCGEPIYFATPTDPVQTICRNQSSTCFNLHVPNSATPATTSDGTLQIWDRSTDQVVGFHDTSRSSDGKLLHHGVDRYFLSSEGLDAKVGGTKGNFGHRGVPAAVRAVRLAEVQAGAINHRLECFWHATAEKVYWPMTGYESGKGGVVPEGVVIRIKPGVDLMRRSLSPGARVIATALQRYGCLIGDNSGSGNTLKLQKADWGGLLTADALRSIPWSDWQFVRGGYRP
jgi:hypothetical protein